MIEDPIPAGTEPIQNDDLYALEQERRAWWGSRREFRDDRVVFFQEGFDAGRYEFTYLLKVWRRACSGRRPRASRRCTCRMAPRRARRSG